ncbi:MAG: Serine/threonine protein kinase [uncultured bacterium]|nr:MAG: Serine/threonine protein kinase [uncultured bacterium]
MIDRETKVNLLRHISEEELYDNWLPVDDLTIREVRDYLSDKNAGRHSKRELNIPFGIFKNKKINSDEIYLIYRKKIGTYKSKEEIPVNIRYNEKNEYTFFEITENDKKFFEVYKEYKLGEGGLGSVKLGINLNTLNVSALKTQKIPGYLQYKIFYREHENLQKLKKAESIPFERMSNKKTHIKKGEFLLAYEKGEDLFSLMNKRQNIEFSQFRWPKLLWIKIGLLIAQELDYLLHSKEYVHLDLKLENIHFDFLNKKIFLLDFASLLKFENKEENRNPAIYKIPCTPEYLAPELRSEEDFAINPGMDVYSVGRVLEEIFFNRDIEYTNNETGESKIVDLENPTHLRENEKAKKLIQEFQGIPEKRPSTQECIHKLQKFHDDYERDHYEEVELIEKLQKEEKEKENQKLEFAGEEIAKHKQPTAPLKRRLLSQEEIYPLTFLERHPYLVRALKWTIGTVRKYCSRKNSVLPAENQHHSQGKKGTNTREIASSLHIAPEKPTPNMIEKPVQIAALSEHKEEHTNSHQERKSITLRRR